MAKQGLQGMKALVVSLAVALVVALVGLLGLWLVFALCTLLAWAVGLARARPGAVLPRWRHWLRAFLQDLRWVYPVYVWWQPFRSQAIADTLPNAPDAKQPGLTGVVLIHGYMCNRGFWTPWMRRLRAQGRPFVALSLEPMFASIDAHAPAVEEAVRRLTLATGRAPLLVAHSMGGLVARAWWHQQCRARREAGHEQPLRERVAGIITLGTPHQGTWLARFSRSVNGRQMRAGSAWLQALAAQEGAADMALFESWSTPCDNAVFPLGASDLPGAAARRLPAEGHVSLAFAPEVWHSVHGRLLRADNNLPAAAPP